MISMARFSVSAMAKSIFRSPIIRQPRVKSPKQLFSHNYAPNKSRYIFKDFTFLRMSNAQQRYKILTNWRQKSDTITEKGRGDEMNYFLKIARDQFEVLRKRRIREVEEDIEALEAEVREMDNKTSIRAANIRKNLMKEIKELKVMSEKLKKSLEKEKKGNTNK